MKRLALTLMCGFVVAGIATAQEMPRVTFDLGAGFTTPVNNTGSYLGTW